MRPPMLGRIPLSDACVLLGDNDQAIKLLKQAALLEEIEVFGFRIPDFTVQDYADGGLEAIPSSFFDRSTIHAKESMISEKPNTQPDGRPVSYSCYVHCCINRSDLEYLGGLIESPTFEIRRPSGPPPQFDWPHIGGVARGILADDPPNSLDEFCRKVRQKLISIGETAPSDSSLERHLRDIFLEFQNRGS